MRPKTQFIAPPQGFGLWAKTRGGILEVPAYKYLQYEYTVHMPEKNFDLSKLGPQGSIGRVGAQVVIGS